MKPFLGILASFFGGRISGIGVSPAAVAVPATHATITVKDKHLFLSRVDLKSMG